jgi:multicomponent Na+:H+ antiporter subunit E
MISPRRRKGRLHPGLIAWLTAIWVLLWSDASLANVVGGILVGAAVTLVMPLNPVPFTVRVRPLGLLVLAARFAYDVVLASVHVALVALRREPPHGAVIRVRLRSHSDVVLTATAELVSLVPGSVVVEAHRFTGTLYVHVLDVGIVGGLEGARRVVLDQEVRVLYAIASREELEACGLPPRRPVRSAVSA